MAKHAQLFLRSVKDEVIHNLCKDAIFLSRPHGFWSEDSCSETKSLSKKNTLNCSPMTNRRSHPENDVLWLRIYYTITTLPIESFTCVSVEMASHADPFDRYNLSTSLL